jgi:hypothetical protein
LGHIKSSHWLHGISIPKVGCHLFGLRECCSPSKREWGIYLFIHIHTMLECIVVLCFWNTPSPSKYLIDLVASHHGC